jgi:hypothetical protein
MEMPQYTESIEIGSAASRIWEMIARPERWSGGYFETRLRSRITRSPTRATTTSTSPGSRRTSLPARSAPSRPPCSRRPGRKEGSPAVCYRLELAGERAGLTVEDEISLLGLAQLAGRDARARWKRSLERLRDATEQR